MAWYLIPLSVCPSVHRCVCASVNFSFKKLLLRNYWLDFYRIFPWTSFYFWYISLAIKHHIIDEELLTTQFYFHFFLFQNTVEYKNDDRYFVLTFVLCGCIAGILLAVVVIYLIKRNTRSKEKLQQIATVQEGNEAASKDYQVFILIEFLSFTLYLKTQFKFLSTLPIPTHWHLLTHLGKKPLQTLWEKEKLLVQAISPFSHNVSYSIEGRNYHFCNICRLQMLSIWSGPNFVVWEWVEIAF